MEQNNPKLKVEPLFSKERYAEFKAQGLSEKDIEEMESAEALAQIADLLPDDPKEVFDKIDALPDDPKEAAKALRELMNSDTESYVQIMAAMEAIDQCIIAEKESKKNK